VERGTAHFSRESVSESPAKRWAQEIRDYLLGRFSSKAATHPLQHLQTTEFPDPPVRRWWTFEGKRYAGLDGPLAANWSWIIQNAWKLLETFNPRLRLSDRLEGAVDWPQTLARGPRLFRAEYVLRSSGVGLTEEEVALLRGWVRWIDKEWAEYTQSVGIENTLDWRNFAADVEGPFSIEWLRRLAHTARRSRWPLLRGVVSETVRPILEPEELDRIPLPSDEAKLFELLCLVRIASCIASPPRELRWMTKATDNTITLDGARIYYQQSLDREIVLATYAHDGPLAPALDLFEVRAPKFVDLAFDFETKRSGFDGLIVEAKCGAQQYEHTVSQLRAYRAARPRRQGQRYLVWGIIENPGRPDRSLAELRAMFAAADRSADVWVFSSADAIPIVLDAALRL
jgi:hypothetical protein